MWLDDPTDRSKKPSVTLTLLVIGFAVATAKLAVSGVEIGPIKFGQFGGVEYSTALAALAGLYWARRNTKEKKYEDTNSSRGNSGSSTTNQT